MTTCRWAGGGSYSSGGRYLSLPILSVEALKYYDVLNGGEEKDNFKIQQIRLYSISSLDKV